VVHLSIPDNDKTSCDATAIALEREYDAKNIIIKINKYYKIICVGHLLWRCFRRCMDVWSKLDRHYWGLVGNEPGSDAAQKRTRKKHTPEAKLQMPGWPLS